MSPLHELSAFTGDSYLVLDCPLSALVQHIAKNLNKQIHCNSPVTKIEHDSNGALVKLYGGRYVNCLKKNLCLLPYSAYRSSCNRTIWCAAQTVNIKLLLTFISTGYMQSCSGSKTATVCGATLAVLGAHDTLFDPKITCNEVLTEMCMPSGRSDVGMWW